MYLLTKCNLTLGYLSCVICTVNAESAKNTHYHPKVRILRSPQNLVFLSSIKNFLNMGLFRRNKNNNKPVIRQILDLVPSWFFESCTNIYKTNKGVRKVTIITQKEITFEEDLFSGKSYIYKGNNGLELCFRKFLKNFRMLVKFICILKIIN